MNRVLKCAIEVTMLQTFSASSWKVMELGHQELDNLCGGVSRALKGLIGPGVAS